jgi:Fur family transcriptional regulator, zinc uptake regulator
MRAANAMVRVMALPRDAGTPNFGGMATAAPTKHTHAHHEGAALLEVARSALEARGEQWTAMRAAVFEVLTGFARPASAYDVTEELGRAQGRRVAANSVYRILDLFVARNLAQRIESANAYLANPHPGCRHDCIFLVCHQCGRATHLDDDAASARVRAAAEAAGFTPERPVIEVQGICADCAAKATAV